MKILLRSMLLPVIICGSPCAAAISTHTFTSCGFPGTGQTAGYTATFGEDNDHQPAASQPSYTIYSINGSSVTVDNRTGLMWMTDANDAGMGGVFYWEDAITACAVTLAGYAGYSDWRLPNIKELVSIADYDHQSPFTNTTYFLNTQGQTANDYWSSTTYALNPQTAWVVDPSGTMTTFGKDVQTYARCVRGGP